MGFFKGGGGGGKAVGGAAILARAGEGANVAIGADGADPPVAAIADIERAVRGGGEAGGVGELSPYGGAARPPKNNPARARGGGGKTLGISAAGGGGFCGQRVCARFRRRALGGVGGPGQGG